MSLTTRGAVVVLALPVIGMLGIAFNSYENGPEPKPPVVIHEDSPGWDCRTMGNRSCVPAENWGTYDGHDGCLAWVGDTTLIRCADGFVTTS